ncbi:colicin [Escherichia coli]|nr:colicin [Escherichia coli]
MRDLILQLSKRCLTLYVLQIPVQNRWGMIQMAMKLWPLIFM